MRPMRCTRGGAAILLAGLSAACQAFEPRGTAENTYMGTNDGTEIEEIVGDPGLQRDLVIENYRSERRDGRLHVQFDLRNMRSSNESFEWALEWFDASGFRIDATEHWTPIALGGKGSETIGQTAPTPDASSFKLHARRPNTVR